LLAIHYAASALSHVQSRAVKEDGSKIGARGAKGSEYPKMD
jgi:hypothetical protein